MSGSSSAPTWGQRAEESAARKYGLRLVTNEWYDGKYTSNGRKVQIKACRKTLASGSKGQYRFWLADHKQLQQHSGAYIVVLYDPDSDRPIRRIEKVSLSEVEKYGSWSRSNHTGGRKQKQKKIVWSRFLSI